MHRFVGRGELIDRAQPAPCRPSAEDGDRYGKRPETDPVQLGRLLHGRIRGPSGTRLPHFAELRDDKLIFRSPRGLNYCIDAKQLERQLASAMVDALIEQPRGSPIPASLEQHATDGPALGRLRLEAVLQIHSNGGTERGAGFGRLSRDDCRTIRRAIETLDIEFDALGVPRLRLSFASQLALSSRLLPWSTIERADALRGSMWSGDGSNTLRSHPGRHFPSLRRPPWARSHRRR